MTSEMQDTPPTQEKRVVIYVVTGRRAGMRRIIGHMIYEVGAKLPKAFKNVHICTDEPPRDVQFVGEYPHYVLYSEVKPVPKPRTPRAVKIIGTDGSQAS